MLLRLLLIVCLIALAPLSVEAQVRVAPDPNKMDMRTQAGAPSNPPAGMVSVWVETASGKINVTNSAGTTTTYATTADVAAAAAGWTDAGTHIYNTTTTDNLHVGGSGAPGGKVAVTGDSDEIQLLIKGNATQTSLLMRAVTSADAERLSLTNAGLLTVVNATVSGLTANSFLYSGAGGALSTTTAPTDGQLLIGSTGVAPVAATLTGTANRVSVTNGPGSITISGPQDLAAASSPTFAALTLTAPLTVANGGSGAATFTANGVLLGNGTSAFAVTAAGTANQVLRIPGAGGAPVFGAIDLAQAGAVGTSILGAANGGTANAFFAVSGPTTATKTFTFPDASATVLTTNAAVTVAQGGTGVGTFTSNGVLYGNGTGAILVTAQGAANTVLTANAGAPSFSATPQIGVAKIGTGLGNFAEFSYNTQFGGLGYALLQDSSGAVYLNAASGQVINIRNNNSTLGTISGTTLQWTAAAVAEEHSTTTLAAAAASFSAASRNIITLTGDAGGNTITSITGGTEGQRIIIVFTDALVTLSDASTLKLNGGFTSSADDTITLVYTGTNWFEVARSVN